MEENTSLMGLPVPRDDYRADLDLLDRETKFSTELTRIALLGLIGFTLGFGFDFGPRRAPFLWLLATGIGYLGFASAVFLGFAHRYRGLELLEKLLRALRLRSDAASRPDESSARREKHGLQEESLSVQRLLAGCVLTTMIGVGCFVLRILFWWLGL